MAKETKKLKKFHIACASALTISILILLASLFLTKDIFINRGFLAEKTFKEAFDARLTGNCESFMGYILTDRDSWSAKCINEKMLHTDPFYDYSVRKVTVLGDKAFVQAELTRGASKNQYPVTYQMKLQNGRWMIDQNSTQ